MRNITNNEVLFVLLILKSPELSYNANSIAKKIGISSMGALKIAKRLEKENIIKFNNMGKAVFFKFNFNNDYARQYSKFLLRMEAENSPAYVKVWISEIRKIKNADAAILFGSILKKHQEANDIDVLFITDQKKFQRAKEEINEISRINIKKIHPVYQTREDFVKNIKKDDKILVNAIKGFVVFGEDLIIDLLGLVAK